MDSKSFKSFRFSVKADERKPGRFSGRASVYGVVDSYQDIVMPGAFTRHLREKGNRIVVLNSHEPGDALGLAELSDSPTALLATGQLELDLQSARDAYTRLKSGLIDGISVGYSVAAGGERYENGHRLLLDLDLWEVSLVTFPANTEARVVDVKRHGATVALADLSTSIQRLTASMRKANKNAGHQNDPAIDELETEFRKLHNAAARWGYDDPAVMQFAEELRHKLNAAIEQKNLASSLAALTAKMRDFTKQLSTR